MSSGYEDQELIAIDAALDANPDATSSEVFQATRPFDERAIASVAASRALAGGGGGGSQTLLDLGVVNLVDLLDGPVTIYTPDNVFVEQVAYTSLTLPDNQIIAVVQGPGAGTDPRLLISFVPTGQILPTAVPRGLISSIPVEAGLTTQQSGYFLDEALGAWQANHVYGEKECISASGHIWSSDPGTSDSSIPDFAGNFGGTVMDGSVLWTDEGPLPTVGSVHLYAQVWSI